MALKSSLFLVLVFCAALAGAQDQNVQARWISEAGTFNGAYNIQDPVHYDRHQDAFAYGPEPGEVFGILYQGPSDSIVRVWVPDQIDVYASEMVGPHKGAIIRATDLEIYFLILSGPKGPGEGEYKFSLFDLSDLGDTEVSNHPDSFSFRMAAVHIAQYRFGDESLEHAQTLDRLADVLAESGRFAEAGENLEHSLRIRERRFGPVSQESIGTVRSIAELYREGEMYREAIPFHQRLVDNNRAGSDGPSVEQAMDAHRLGFVFYRADDYEAAAEAWEESATIHDNAPDRNVSLFALTLDELGSVHRKMGNTAESLLWRQRREEFIRTTDLRNSDTHASALNTLGVAHANYGDDANAMRSYRQAIEMRDVLGLSDTSPQATTHYNLGIALNRNSAFHEAIAQFRRSREIYEFLGRADTVFYANVLRNLANTLGTLREIDEAIELSRRAIDIYTASLAPDHNLLGVAFNDLGIIYRSDGQYDEAEQWLRRSLEIRGRQLPANPVVYATVLENLAGVLQWQDRDDEAEGMFRESLRIHRDQLSPDHPSVGRAANNLGFFLLLQDRHMEAEVLFRENLEIRFRNGLGELFGSSTVRINLGDVLYWSGRFGEAAQRFAEARQIRADTVGESDARYANAVDRLADSYRRLGEHELAQPLYDEALAVRASSQGTDHFEYAATAAMAALTEFALGNTEEAQRLAAEAVEIRSQRYVERHYLTAIARANFGAILAAEGDVEIAEAMIREAGSALPASDLFAFFDYLYTVVNFTEIYRQTDRAEQAYELVAALAELTLETLGSSSLLTAATQRRHGESLMEQGRFADAADALRESVYTLERASQSILPHVSPEDAGTLRDEWDRYFWSFARLIGESDESVPWAAGDLYDLLLIRGGVFPSISSVVRRGIEADTNKDLVRHYERWRAWVSQLEPPEPVFPAFIAVERRDYDQMLADAENQRLMLEGMTSRPLSIELPEQIFWNLIQDQLKPGEIAVELMANSGESGPAYAAVVLSSVDVPKAVLLESAELHELAATAAEGRALQPEARTRAARLLWGPILETTEETVVRIYVNPEGLYEEATGPDYAEWTGAEIVPLASTRELMDR